MPRAADPNPRLAAFFAVILVLTACVSARSLDPSLERRLGDLLLVGFHGTEVDGNAQVRHLVCDLRVGGVVLFERDAATQAPRNITSREQLGRLTGDLQALARGCAGRPLLIAVDSEGGAVMRLSPRVGYSPTLSAHELGTLGDLTVTELEALRIARMLREAGINWTLAPVVDVAVNPLNPVIVRRGRAFSLDPEVVTAHARAYLQALRDAGLRTTLKHFPGHGSSWEDSHRGFVDVTETASPEIELHPYRELINHGFVDSVMTAHVVNRNLDPDYPATLSRPTIHGLLRDALGFRGVVVSDDLMMRAITEEFGLEEAAVLALGAGVDILLISDARPGEDPGPADRAMAGIRNALARGMLSRSQIEAALARIDRFRAGVGGFRGSRPVDHSSR
ncbi:MAG: glycoside hydrolase family 3 [Candidatus Rokubacteria bacterium]|nr:glycoside hydrolase family 3 [Candidatus Rokubacteria bacterium]